ERAALLPRGEARWRPWEPRRAAEHPCLRLGLALPELARYRDRGDRADDRRDLVRPLGLGARGGGQAAGRPGLRDPARPRPVRPRGGELAAAQLGPADRVAVLVSARLPRARLHPRAAALPVR